MKISDLLPRLVCDKVFVAFGGMAREIDRADPLMTAAYGDFLVSTIQFSCADGKSMCEISVASAPARGVA